MPSGHGHAHHHHHHDDGDWGDLTAAPVRRLLTTVVIVLGLAALVGLAIWWPRGEMEVDRDAAGFGDRRQATVTDAVSGPCSYDPNTECRLVTFDIDSGPDEGTTGSIETDLASNTPAAELDAGDGIIVNDGGADTPPESRYSFADLQRGSSLWALAGLFALAVVALGRLRGLLALAGIAVSGVVLLGFVFPALLHGSSPLGVALTASAIIAFATLYLAHGLSERTTVALLGTLASLLVTAALALIFAGAAELSGLASEESVALLTFAPGLDFRGLLLAAVIIGTLGVLDDVTVTQVSAVWELHRNNPDATGRQLYASGIRIGRDHIASTVNTLVLAYTAAALPLLLLFTQSGMSLGEVLTSETVAVEVVQTLVGSIGLVASVPLTTALACWVVTRSDEDDGGAGDVGFQDGFDAYGERPVPEPGPPPGPYPSPYPDPPARDPRQRPYPGPPARDPRQRPYPGPADPPARGPERRPYPGDYPDRPGYGGRPGGPVRPSGWPPGPPPDPWSGR